MKNTVKEVANEVLGKQKKKRNKPWITEETLKLLDKRRSLNKRMRTGKTTAVPNPLFKDKPDKTRNGGLLNSAHKWNKRYKLTIVNMHLE